MEDSPFRVRLRVRLAKPLNTKDVKRTINIGSRTVTVGSQQNDQPLEDAKWIIFGVGGFQTKLEAEGYGVQLKAAVELAGLCDRLGLDVGLDRATSWINEKAARQNGLPADVRIQPNIHGLAVMPDDGKNLIPLFESTGIVRASAEQFEDALVQIGSQLPLYIPTAAKGVRLMNLAIMTSEPIAQIALAISAVEELGQDEQWNDAQRELIERLAVGLETDPSASADGLEVSEALRRSLHKIGLRQGVMRVLDRLGLNHLRREWDRLYSLRSAIFHGTGDLSQIDLSTIATETITACGAIILAAAQQDGCKLPPIAKIQFPESAPPQ